ncbi:MAG TPA: hypothetical protein PKC39_06485 [Ferruginibacter sp.]|nr:hypothetical protein [Ferruginibacter sp.]HMP20585.1 hypothetical protein [Ferruginibacter sp.]
MNILKPIQDLFQKVLLYIFRLVCFAFRRLRFAGRGIKLEDKITDFNDIFKTTRLFFVFNLLALLIFTMLPQGKDVILVVIEDLSEFKILSTISLLFGLTGWCLVSEFGARYKIYVADNSGLLLTNERVNFRKEAQKFVSTLYLLLPIMIVMLSVIIVTFSSVKQWKMHDVLPFATLLVLLVLLFALLSKYYLDDFYIGKLRKKKVWYKVSAEELRWANKLFGIYSDFVYMIRKANNFKGYEPTPEEKQERQEVLDKMYEHDKAAEEAEDDNTAPMHYDFVQTYQRYTSLIEALPPHAPGCNDVHDSNCNTITHFPVNYTKKHDRAPELFMPVEFSTHNTKPVRNKDYEAAKNNKSADAKDEPEFLMLEQAGGYYRWMYKNNPSFYKTLHLQVHVVSISSLIFLLLVSAGDLVSYNVIGVPALVCLSFACWLGVYTGLLYIDKRFRRNIKLSVRFLLFIWVLIVSYINSDHPVRKSDTTAFNSIRPPLHEHFGQWYQQYIRKMPLQEIKGDSTAAADSLRNVFFITAEGGASRTGAFAALLLAKIMDTLPRFKDQVYAFSTVSGGTLGISFFNAITYIEPTIENKAADYYQHATKAFFSQDQLSAPIAKWLYGDILACLWPAPIQRFDRAVALEKAWEHSYGKVFKKPQDVNVFSTNFLSNYNNHAPGHTIMPAWFINTVEVETGLQCYISNVRADSFILARQRDLLGEKIRHGINYSTAVGFSTRFPLFSPSAAIYHADDKVYHYVDGGYVENAGSKTMLEVLQDLDSVLRANKIKPWVIQIMFSDPDSSAFQSTGFLNEFSSIANGIYNTRAGSGATYRALLQKEVAALGGQIIEVPLEASGSDVPMSWIFSERSLRNLDTAVLKTWYNQSAGKLRLRSLPIWGK